MGALPYAGYLWLTYSRQTPGIGNACTDSGQIDGRPYDQIYGCMLFGRVSRFPYDAATATITGPEDIVMDGENNDKQGCSQFSTHGITGLVVGADNFIYFSFGEGASFQAPDNGEFGNNPCNDRPGYTGAYRAMDPERYAGKIVRVDPVTAELVIVTSGHRNPFRLTVWNGQLYESETGWFTYEEVNLINTDVTVPFLNKQYGWPCYEGPVLQQIYSGQNMPPCVALQAAGNAVMPWFYYEARRPPPLARMRIEAQG